MSSILRNRNGKLNISILDWWNLKRGKFGKFQKRTEILMSTFDRFDIWKKERGIRKIRIEINKPSIIIIRISKYIDPLLSISINTLEKRLRIWEIQGEDQWDENHRMEPMEEIGGSTDLIEQTLERAYRVREHFPSSAPLPTGSRGCGALCLHPCGNHSPSSGPRHKCNSICIFNWTTEPSAFL